MADALEIAGIAFEGGQIILSECAEPGTIALAFNEQTVRLHYAEFSRLSDILNRFTTRVLAKQVVDLLREADALSKARNNG